jgi:hypothetical protein
MSFCFLQNWRKRGQNRTCLGFSTVGGGGYKERMWEGEYVEYYTLMNENGKIRPVESIPGMEEGG